ncbi:MAG: hypothetical protein R2851_16740 [Caldilineaceae bacterium]
MTTRSPIVQKLSSGTGHRLVRARRRAHTPGSLCTYEPQWASDVFAMFQSLVAEVPIDGDLVKNVPADKHQDLDFLVSMVDWDANVCPASRKPTSGRRAGRAGGGDGRRRLSRGLRSPTATTSCGQGIDRPARARRGYQKQRSLRLHHDQGHGARINGQPLETPALIRFGQLTYDEYFVAAGRRAASPFTTRAPGDPWSCSSTSTTTPEAPQK